MSFCVCYKVRQGKLQEGWDILFREQQGKTTSYMKALKWSGFILFITMCGESYVELQK